MPSYAGAECSEAQPDPSKECVLYMIPGYTCEKYPTKIICKSFNRLFKQCPGQPRVEMVPENGTFVDIQNHKSLSSWQPSFTPAVPSAKKDSN